MTDEDAWRTEERLDPACVMAFPAPAGIMHGAGIAESLAGAPRWSSVAMADRHVGRAVPDVHVLAYRARAQSDGAAPYEAYCTSTYRRDGDRWRLVQHQQTPA